MSTAPEPQANTGAPMWSEGAPATAPSARPSLLVNRGFRAATPIIVAPPAIGVAHSFSVSGDARIQADTDNAHEAAESILYIARLAEAVGHGLGAGALTAVEVTGRAAAYAAIETDASGRTTVQGLLDIAGSPTEDLRAAVTAARGTPGGQS